MSTRDGLSDWEFNAIRQLIYQEAGISLSSAKRSLVQSRLAKRLRALSLQTHTEYLEYLENNDPGGAERQTMVNCLTTNKTDFFREPHHFDFLRDVVFPSVRQQAAHGGPRELNIWSAACSMGDEPYTIAMTVLEHFGSLDGWNVRILATDINTEVLEIGRRAIYASNKIEMLSDTMRAKYFLRGTGEQRDRVRVRDEVRRLVTFRQVNLLADPLQVRGKFDVIFCRNVIIYFNEATQRKLLPQFASRLNNRGYLMLGHSENLPWLAESFEPIGGTVHRLRGNGSTVKESPVSLDRHPDDAPLGSALRPPTAARRVNRNSDHLATGKIPAGKTHRSTSSSLTEARLPARHSLVAGETFASAQEVDVSTVLGSCIATCLYDPIARVGGMNHYMLPAKESADRESARYGVHAMELLINKIMNLGGDRRRFVAKVFGGANVLSLGPNSPSIGRLNIDFVRSFLRVESIPIKAEKVGGEKAMLVHFHCHSGRAFVKLISTSRSVVSEEREFALNSYVTTLASSGEQVTLF